MLHRLVLYIELSTVQTEIGKVDSARKFKCTTAAHELKEIYTSVWLCSRFNLEIIILFEFQVVFTVSFFVGNPDVGCLKGTVTVITKEADFFWSSINGKSMFCLFKLLTFICGRSAKVTAHFVLVRNNGKITRIKYFSSQTLFVIKLRFQTWRVLL